MRRVVALCLGWIVAATGVQAQPRTDDGVVRFSWPDTTARSVSLAGDFNGWSPTATPLDREDGVWLTRVFLDPGSYEYKFMVDGVLQADPGNPERTTTGNSVVRVAADGSVLPPRTATAASDSAAGFSFGALSWQGRAIGAYGARKSSWASAYTSHGPDVDLDLRLDAKLDDTADAWFLLHTGNDTSDHAVRWDRGLIAWRPSSFTLRVFDNVGITDFDDPGVLVGRVGRYADSFGFGRLGAQARRRIFGAPFEVLYADDREAGTNVAPPTALPDLHGPEGALLADSSVRRYVRTTSDRGNDTAALRGRLGTESSGLGLGLRVDRGANAGRVADLAVRLLPGDTLVASGRELRTTESWGAWSLDLRGRIAGVRTLAEFMTGTLRARAVDAAPIVRMRAAPGATTTERQLGPPDGNSDGFDLDTSARVVLHLDSGRSAGRTHPWTARPGTGAAFGPEARYEYEEHNFTALPTGAPFLNRRHAARAGIDFIRGDLEARIELEQHWFEYPADADWASQFWLRAGNFWLDEDVVSIDRVTLLGPEQAATARLHLSAILWPSRGLRLESHTTWAAPGFDRSPRHVEEVLRLAYPLPGRFELRAHSRLALYRRFEPTDSTGVARLGPGARIEAGEFDLEGIAVDRSHRLFGAHFIECVYAISERSDVALGFGVDPWIVHEATNEFAPIGWDEFLFDGIGDDVTGDPESLGKRLDAAEDALEQERRLTLEVRLRF